ncbi:hypothetical protein VTH82DRAFT_7435 [Thermothelomyces myriococcoides]
MAVEGATQALVAAFFFGIVLSAASAALVLVVKGTGFSAVFRDSQRLVLVLFLLSAALWAQTDFISILLDITTSNVPCQVGVIFATVFDQLARFSVEQFLLWGLNIDSGAKLSLTQLIPQALVLGRFLAGAVFTGFIRPQTDDFCVATTSVLPVGILVTGLDGAIISLLVIRAYSPGGAAKENQGSKGAKADRARALMSVLLGLVFWTGASVPMLLGFTSLALGVRTALPAGGLLLLIILVAGGADTLLPSRKASSHPPEAPSPRRINISRDISTSDTDYPPTRFEDLKEAALRSSKTFVNPREAPKVKDETSIGFATEVERSRAMPKAGQFDFGKGKPTISQPILLQNGDQNPTTRIALMGLEEAAAADRERRIRAHQDEGAKANARAVARSNSMAPEDALKRGISLKRKEVASTSTRESLVPGVVPSRDRGAVARTTSAQLSPGGEETRRRSPRPSPKEESAPPAPAFSTKTEEAPEANAQPLPTRPLTSQQPLLRPDIRPSRTLPPSPPTPPPEPTKTPLRRRPTIGLPSNPRAQGVKVAEEPGSQHRTILFLNNIQYNDPSTVEAIIKTAGNPSTKRAPPAEKPPSPQSIVHRPRPIPRKPADSPAELSPALIHRRTKSGGSLMARKSRLGSSPGSPTALPPLPSLPVRSATVASRPHPNSTKSMTVEEKVTLFFPNPPSRTASKRRSSVPEVPRIPPSYIGAATSPTKERQGKRASGQTTETSTWAERSVSEVEEIQRRSGKTLLRDAGEAGNVWLRAFDGNDGANPRDGSQPQQTDGKRDSPTIAPSAQPRISAWTETTYDNSDDEGMNWSSINTPEVAIGIPVVRKIGLPAAIRMARRQNTKESQLSSATDNNRVRETLPIVLDESPAPKADAQGPPAPQAEAPVTAPQMPTWHHRVGEQCPTFSVRKTETKARKMPPPAPLPLHTISTKKVLAIHQAEPSPLESPGEAIRQIQAQLRKLDDLPHHTPESASRRMELLKDLEREMGQQAEHWQEIKHDMGRDSMSTMQSLSPSVRDSKHASVASSLDLVRVSAQRRSGLEHWALQGVQVEGDNNLRVPNTREASVRDSSSPKLSKWQKRLTEAQMDYMDAKLLTASNVSFVQLSKAQLASPTPPDSDDSEIPPLPILPVKKPAEEPREHASLWKPAPKVTAPTGFLWTAPLKSAPEPEVPLPGLSLRPAQRKELPPLQIESKQLWRKPHNTTSRATSGLWRPVWASAAPPAEPLTRVPSKSGSTSRKPPRPVTQRPPRRSKRLTQLPDILESPEPLPDKRGTLGIFQFPWGEKSDTASIQPRPSVYMAMPGTMTSGGPSGGTAGFPKQSMPTDYSSSFFDEYDDDGDDQIVVDMDSYEEESDDEFDDSTLWEIASLLRTDSIPSRDSLFPPPSESAAESDTDEPSSDGEQESIVIGLDAPLEVLSEQQRDSATLESSALLALKNALESKTSPRPAVRVGLPAHPKAYRDSREAPAAPGLTSSPEPSSPVARQATEVQEIKVANEQYSVGLWNPPSPAPTPSALYGLFVPGRNPSDYRSTSEEPAALVTRRMPRLADQRPLERLTSTKLWAPENAVNKGERNWILGEQPMRKAAKEQYSTGLWNPPIPTSMPLVSNGLFVAGRSSSEYRSTSEEPAALVVRLAPRPVDQRPLERLTSTKLWAPENVVNKGERNWILTEQPKPKATKPWRQHFTREGWQAALREAIQAGRSVTKKPRRRAATKAEWEAALHEAIQASRSVTRKLERRAATKAEWEAALQEAISLSYPAVSAHAEEVLPSQYLEDVNSSEQHQLVQEEEDEGVTSSYVPSPVPEALEAPPRYEHDAIQARIEELEQERMFVERAAREEYHRRTNMTFPAAVVMEEEQQPSVAMDGLAGVDLVQELQRRLSLRIRQSLVINHPAPPVPVSEEPKEKPKTKNKEVRFVSPDPREPAQDRQDKRSLLWERPRPMPVATTGMSAGLWSAIPDRNQSVAAPSTEEDEHTASQRAQRRRMLQKRQHTQEGDESLLVNFAGMSLWVSRVQPLTRRTTDWLHSACVSRPKGVKPISTQKLWTAPVSSVITSSPNGLWVAPVTTSRHSSSSLLLSEDVSVALQWTMFNQRRRQETPIEEVPRGTEMWSQKSGSVVSQVQKTKRDWLHSTCMAKATGLWTAPERPVVSSSQNGLWTAPTRSVRSSPSLSLSEGVSATAQWTMGYRRQCQETSAHADEVLSGAKLWSRESSGVVSQGSRTKHDWLHSTCMAKTTWLWTAPVRSVTSSSPNGLWTAPTRTHRSSPSPYLSQDESATAQRTITSRRWYQETSTSDDDDEVLIGAELWSQENNSAASQGFKTKRDWLHSTCVVKAKASKTKSEKQWLWAAPLRSHAVSSQTGLWEMSKAGGKPTVSSSPDSNTLTCGYGSRGVKAHRQPDMSAQLIEIDLGAELWYREISK